MTNITLDLSPIVTLDRQEFRKLCAANPEMKLERTSEGKLIVMAPTGGETGNWNSELNVELGLWNRQSQGGKTFDSSTGFELPKGSDRSPDAAWLPIDKWNALTPEERRGFLPLCPDFIIELLSPTDSWKQTAKKMEEYRDNGCRLGWLIDPKSKKVAIYRLDRPVEILTAPDTLSGEDVLIGMVLDLRFLWTS
jgi:Uma2 family endonuclease